jgi:hypothetical protein
MALELQLNRIDRQKTYTGGVLSVFKANKWVPILATLEDPIRDLKEDGSGKVYADTAIGAGRYQVKLEYSPGFKKILPRLFGVKFFAGILMHIGNWTKDTKGCILVALRRNGNALVNSKDGMKILMDLLQQATDEKEEIYITIVNG